MGSPAPSDRSEALYASSVFAVFALALFVRIGGISQAEPFMPHPDEAGFVTPALRILVRGDLNPHWFGHPGSLTIYCLSALYGIDALLRGEPFADLLRHYAQDPEPFHLLGRQLIVLGSMVTHLGLWLLARRFVSRWPALLAVFLLACAPLDIKLAGYIRTDTQQSALLVILCLFLLSAVRTGAWRSFLGAGFLLGLATAVKWPSVVLGASIALAAFLSPQLLGRMALAKVALTKVALAKVGAAAVASAAGLFLAAPYVFLDFGTVLGDVAREARSYHMSATSPGFFPTLGHYLVLSLWDLALPGFLLALLGVVVQFKTATWRQHAVIVSVFAIYLVFISAQSLRWSRWAVPLLPYPCLWAALGAKATFDFVGRRFQSPLRSRGFSLTLSALVLAVGASQVAALVQARARQPAPVVFSWVSSNLPKNSKILAEKDTPPLPKALFDLRVVDRKSGSLKRAQKTGKYSVPTGTLMDLKDADAVLQVDYVILGNRYRRVRAEPERQQKALRIYEAVMHKTEHVHKIGSYEIRRVKRRRR